MIYNAVLPGKGARTVPRVQKMETKRVAHKSYFMQELLEDMMTLSFEFF